MIRIICVLLLIAGWPVALLGAPDITHGAASGDITDHSAVVWARASKAAEMSVKIHPVSGLATISETKTSVTSKTDFTGQVLFSGLLPDTAYRFDVAFRNGRKTSPTVSGLFRTAPEARIAKAVSFIWAGDLAGQRYCRRVDGGYRIFGPMLRFGGDFFVANGDMIYADNDCPVDSYQPGWKNIPGDFPGIRDPSVNWTDALAVREVFDAHWRYNRADPTFQRFLAVTPMIVQWDDHEIANDFGGAWDAYPAESSRAGYPTVVAEGLASFFNYHPITRNRQEENRIYRSIRWGQQLELFILDARSYRSENSQQDSASKTMLGAAQLQWLKHAMAESDAVWKVVSSDVPLAVATGGNAQQFGRDAFANGTDNREAMATGFETELLDLLSSLDSNNVRNTVFVATDVHFAAQLRYHRDFDGDGDKLLLHELVSGPLSAVRAGSPPRFDPTLGPVILYAEGGIFNFGTVSIDSRGLKTDIRDENGVIRPGSQLSLTPE